MKISIVADLHLNDSTYSEIKDSQYNHLPFRTGDAMRAFEYIVTTSIQEKVSDFVCLGDIFDNPNPHNDVSAFLNSQVLRLLNEKIKIHLLVGNHDAARNHHALRPLQELQLINVIDKPHSILSNGMAFHFFPHSMEIEQGIIAPKKAFMDFAKTIIEDKSRVSFFFGHLGLNGASVNQYVDKSGVNLLDYTSVRRMRKKNWYDSDADKVSVGDLELLNVDYVFLGDYHRYQKLPVQKNVAMYVGSIERTDFNEIGQKKGFVIFDTEATEDKVRFVEYKGCRKFVELIGSLNDIKEAAKRLDIEGNQNSVVKLTFRGTNADYIEYSKKHDRIKEWINSKLNPVHFIFDREIMSLFTKPVVSEVTESESVVDASKIDAPEERMVLSVVADLIDEIEKNDVERSSLKKLAEEIYIQTNTVGA